MNAPENQEASVEDKVKVSLKESFSALGDRSSHKKELKEKQHEYDILVESISSNKAILVDQRDILARYPEIVAELVIIIQNSTESRELAETRMSELQTELDPPKTILIDLQNQHYPVLQQLEQSLRQAEDNLRSVTGELSDAERERDSCKSRLWGAEDNEKNLLQAQLTAAENNVSNWEKQESSATRMRDSAKTALDDQKRCFDDIEEPYAREVRRLESLISSEWAIIGDMRARIDNALSRIEYCTHVWENPEETDALASQIESDEQTEITMSEEVAQLKLRDATSKAASKKAKIFIGGAIMSAIFVIILIITVVIDPFGWRVAGPVGPHVGETTFTPEMQKQLTDTRNLREGVYVIIFPSPSDEAAALRTTDTFANSLDSHFKLVTCLITVGEATFYVRSDSSYYLRSPAMIDDHFDNYVNALSEDLSMTTSILLFDENGYFLYWPYHTK